jgi:hypothetical protein
MSEEADDMGSNAELKCDTSILVQLERVLGHIFVDIGTAGKSPKAEEWNTSTTLNAHTDTSSAHDHNKGVHSPVVDLCK